MPKIETIGRLLLKDSLPENLKEFDTILDKKGVKELFTELAKTPEKYVDTLHKLETIARTASTERGGEASLSLRDLELPVAMKLYRKRLVAHINTISQNPKLTMQQKNTQIVKYIRDRIEEIHKDVREASVKDKNSFAAAIQHGFRGSPVQLTQILFGDLLVSDHKGAPIPIPGLHGYGEGVTPLEYWAGAFASRKGFTDVQFSTSQTGYFGKRLALSANKIRVTGKDCGAENIGLQREGGDPDNIGAVLAQDIGKYKKGTVIDKKMLSDLEDKTVLLRSISTCQQPEGVCQICSGKREDNEFPTLGEYIGVKAARVISEPLTQLGLSLSADTQILMANFDSKELKDIEIGDWIIGSDREGNTKPVKVLNKYDHGMLDVFEYVYTQPRSRAKIKQTVSIKCTKDHKILSSYLFSGRMSTPLELRAGTNKTRISAITPKTFSGHIGSKNEPLAFIIGLLLGDGGYSKGTHQIAWSCADEDLLENVKRYLNTFDMDVRHNNKVKYHLCMKQNDYSGAHTNNLLKAWLKDNDMYHKYSYEKELPKDIYEWDINSIKQLISGLYLSDGSFVNYNKKQKNNKSIQYCSSSYKLVSQLKTLLQNVFCIYSGAICENKNNRQWPSEHSLYTIHINNITDIQKFINSIPLVGKKAATVEKWTFDDCRRGEYRRCLKVEEKYFGKMHTYDIEVDNEDHLFVTAAGIITSNSSKHTGGALGKEDEELSGFEEIQQFADVPEQFLGKAILAPKDGKVTKIYKAPQGGHYVIVNGEQLYVPINRNLGVKIGDEVEAGDILTDGTPNPAEIAEYKGLGEGRKYFVDKFSEILERNGVRTHRRNVEVVARGFFDKVRITNPDGVAGYDIDEKVPYSDLQRNYEPRPGSQLKTVNRSISGQYLEKPILHYTIGTRLTPKVIKKLQAAGIKDVISNTEHPGFEPEVVRLLDITNTDPDWKIRMAGFGLKSSFLDAVVKGSESKYKNPSYIPGLMDVSKL